MGDDDLLHFEMVLVENGDDVIDVIAGIDDHGFAGGFITDDGAVALERADGEYFVDHAGYFRSNTLGGATEAASL